MKRKLAGGILRLLRSSLFQNAGAMALVQAGTGFVPLVTIPYLARVLGATGWGLVAFAQAFGMYVSVLGEYGFLLSATREVARHREDPDKLAHIVAGVLGAKIVLAIAAVAAAFAAYCWIPIFEKHPLLLWIGAFWALMRSSSMIWYFQGRERLRLVAWLDIVGQGLAALAIFVLVRAPGDEWRVLGLQGLGYFLTFAVGLALAYREVPFLMPRWGEVRETLRLGWSMFVFRGSVSLYTTGNAFVLGLFVAPVWVGYYAGAEKICRAFQALLNPVSQSFYPRISNLVIHARDRAAYFAKISLGIMGVGGLALGIFVFALAPPLVRLVLGSGYEAAVPVLRILALLIPLIAFSMVYGVQWMVPLGMERFLNRIIILAGIINVSLAALFARTFLAAGMACAVVTAETFVAVSIFVFLRMKKADPLSYRARVSGTASGTSHRGQEIERAGDA